LNLEALGWSPFFADGFEPYREEGVIPARVAIRHHGPCVLFAELGELGGVPAGRLDEPELPAVGDWVAARPLPGERKALIEAVLPRRSAFTRKEAWRRTAQQVVAANVDTVFLVSDFGRDLNVRRLERYLAAAWESGAEPVIVVNKADLVADPAAALADVEAIAFGVPVHPVSAATGEGLEALATYLVRGRTVALLGSSGVGKSTLVNRVSGRTVLATAETRSDGRGRHTTTHRELVPLPGGALLLDTPGMRELQLWGTDDGLERTFADVAALASACRFNDCAHESEPGCAVRAALDDGSLAADRWESYRKLQRELRALEIRQDARLRSEARKQIRRFSRGLRKVRY
jgi:ribosome biogenesis GTPase / thiamine phosphate phosphatase